MISPNREIAPLSVFKCSDTVIPHMPYFRARQDVTRTQAAASAGRPAYAAINDRIPARTLTATSRQRSGPGAGGGRAQRWPGGRDSGRT